MEPRKLGRYCRDTPAASPASAAATTPPWQTALWPVARQLPPLRKPRKARDADMRGGDRRGRPTKEVEIPWLKAYGSSVTVGVLNLTLITCTRCRALHRIHLLR